MAIEQIRQHILELCAESEHGSWEFWSDKENRSEKEFILIHKIIVDLTNRREIYPIEYQSVKNQTYKEVPLDIDRIQDELKRSMRQDVEQEKFYWFVATDKGKETDQLSRSHP
jgi:hypothetical protein